MIIFSVFSFPTALRKAQTVIPTDANGTDSTTNNQGQSNFVFPFMLASSIIVCLDFPFKCLCYSILINA